MLLQECKDYAKNILTSLLSYFIANYLHHYLHSLTSKIHSNYMVLKKKNEKQLELNVEVELNHGCAKLV